VDADLVIEKACRGVCVARSPLGFRFTAGIGPIGQLC
jgi:hypothetical protein